MVHAMDDESPDFVGKAAADGGYCRLVQRRLSARVSPALAGWLGPNAVTTLDLVRRGATLDTEVQVLRLNPDVAIVLLPGEVFADLGLAIKRRSPFKHTLVIELSNDNPAYIPTEQAFKEGSYETVNSRIAPGGGERLVETAIQLLNDIAEK